MSSSAAEAAFALLQGGRLAEAEAAWRAILERSPGDARALHFLGCTVARAGRIDEGLALIDRSIAIEGANASFYNNRAGVLEAAGRIDEALADLRRALQRDPAFAAACLHLGVLLRRQGRGAEAIAALRRAAALAPRDAAVATTLARALHEAGDFAGAAQSLQSALALRPGDPEVLNNLGLARHAAGRRDEALAAFEQALRSRPAFPEALVNSGNVLKDRGELDAAAVRYERALEVAPGFVEARINAAGCELDRGNLAAARTHYERVLALQPDAADARYGLGQVALREGRMAEGWAGYEARFATHPPQSQARAFDIPRLEARSLRPGMRVAVWAEQGVGDQILFSTLLPELVARGVRPVVEVDPRLLAIYRRSVPGIEFVARAASGPSFAACDAHVPVGSLGAILRGELDDFARQPARLLAPDPERVARFRERLGAGPCIAISWRSLQKGDRQALAARKSIPLSAFAPLVRAGARLLDLQYGDVGEERAAFEAAHPGALLRFADVDPWHDLEGLIAAMAACARVVTASNVTAHLAGASGVAATVVFLRAVAPFHYWAVGRGGRSLWYPSVELPTEPWETWEAAFESLARRAPTDSR